MASAVASTDPTSRYRHPARLPPVALLLSWATLQRCRPYQSKPMLFVISRAE